MTDRNTALLQRIERHEGERLEVYDDATGAPIVRGSKVIGNPTIGVGTLLSAPGGISNDESMMLLENRVAMARKLAQTLPVYAKLNDARQDVLVEMVFQMGLAGVQGFTNTLAKMYAGDFTGAADGMRLSKWARQTPERADELAGIMEKGVA